MYIYIYIYVCVCVCVCVYTHTHTHSDPFTDTAIFSFIYTAVEVHADTVVHNVFSPNRVQAFVALGKEWRLSASICLSFLSCVIGPVFHRSLTCGRHNVETS